MTATKPLYLQIREDIRTKIRSGEFSVGTMLPTENDLAQLYETTRLTVRNAIDGLEKEGTVQRIQGKGSFVMSPMNTSAVRPMGFRERSKALHANATVRILQSVVREAGSYYGRLFGIARDADLLSLRRLNSIDGRPLSLEEVVVPVQFFPGIEDVDFSVFSLYDYYQLHGRAVAKCYESIDVVTLSARDARLLDQSEGDPALFLDCLSYDAQGLLVEHAISYNVGSEGVYKNFG